MANGGHSRVLFSVREPEKGKILIIIAILCIVELLMGKLLGVVAGDAVAGNNIFSNYFIETRVKFSGIRDWRMLLLRWPKEMSEMLRSGEELNKGRLYANTNNVKNKVSSQTEAYAICRATMNYIEFCLIELIIFILSSKTVFLFWESCNKSYLRWRLPISHCHDFAFDDINLAPFQKYSKNSFYKLLKIGYTCWYFLVTTFLLLKDLWIPSLIKDCQSHNRFALQHFINFKTLFSYTLTNSLKCGKFVLFSNSLHTCETWYVFTFKAQKMNPSFIIHSFQNIYHKTLKIYFLE